MVRHGYSTDPPRRDRRLVLYSARNHYGSTYRFAGDLGREYLHSGPCASGCDALAGVEISCALSSVVERRIFNPQVVGSIPTGHTNFRER